MKRILLYAVFFMAVFLAGCQSPKVFPLETQSFAPTQSIVFSTGIPSTTKLPTKTATLFETSIPLPSPTPVPPGIFTGWLAFVAYRADYPVLYAIQQDGSGLTTLIDQLSGIGSPSWSPDGKRIAFHAFSPKDGLWDIFILEMDGSTLTHLPIPEENFYPAWSPDGTQIAFISNHEELQTDLYVMDSDGTHLTRLTHNDTWQRLLAWSPDGTRLLFSMDSPDGPGLYTVKADGTGQEKLVEDPSIRSASWSPDSGSAQRIAFSSDRDGDLEIYVMAADGSDIRQFTYNEAWDSAPAWSPDGGLIAFLRSIPHSGSELYLMNADGTEARAVPNTQGFTGELAWYPPVEKAAAASLSFGPTATVPAPTVAAREEAGDEALAREALLSFFSLLQKSQYAKALAFYRGSFGTLIDWNPTVDPRDRTTLFQRGCEINGLECQLHIRSAQLKDRIAPVGYRFVVEFENADGSLFVLGPCCGGNETDTPPISQFEYTVIKDGQGHFRVQELPVLGS
jgi:Tol biopolymer transport system component